MGYYVHKYSTVGKRIIDNIEGNKFISLWMDFPSKHCGWISIVDLTDEWELNVNKPRRCVVRVRTPGQIDRQVNSTGTRITYKLLCLILIRHFGKVTP